MIPFIDFTRINNDYNAELKQVAEEVILSGKYVLGEKVEEFEKKLSEYLGVKYVIGVGSGYDALKIIFRSYIELGLLNKGDEIVVPANTYIATILPVTENYFKPVFVEPDINTYNIDVNLIERSITERTRAVVVVHLYGRACWDNELKRLKEKYNLLIFEDNAHALGAEVININNTGYKEYKKTGSLGDAAAMSFYPTKNLGALGDGGAVATNDKNLAEVVKAIRNYGSLEKNIHLFKGVNSRLDEIQAAFLIVKLKYLEKQLEEKRKIADYYLNKLNCPGLILPVKPVTLSEKKALTWHLFPVRHKYRDKLKEHLLNNGIQTQIHYPVPPHFQKALMEFNDLKFPVTEELHNTILSLPIWPGMKANEIQKVINTVNSF